MKINFVFSCCYLNKEGDISKWFGKTIIHSDRRFSYEEAQDIIEG
jgi:ribonuclease R